MGTYVDKISSTPFDFGNEVVLTSSQIDEVQAVIANKFNVTMATAEDMLQRLVGTNGDAGYLGRLYEIIEEYRAPEITDFTVTVPTISVPITSRPAPTVGDLDLDFPVFDKAAPSLSTLPAINTDGLTPSARPDSITDTFSWTESEHVSGVYATLLSRLITYLTDGSTGLAADVEQALIDRAQARQDIIDEKLERETLGFFESRNFDLPTGVEDAAIALLAAERSRNRTDLNEKVFIEQAELAQKNGQFILGIAKDLEVVLRDFTNKTNDRALDAAKASAANAIAIFSENVKAYIAEEDGKLKNLSVQVEHLKGVVEANRGLVALYQAEGEAYNTTIEGKSKRNESITKIYDAEVSGYSAEMKAIADAAGVTIEEYKLRVQNADMQLRKAIAEVEASLGAYRTESELRARVSTDMANIAMQTVASAYGAVNASAGMSFSVDKNKSESFAHNESRQVDYRLDNSLTETHSFKEES